MTTFNRKRLTSVLWSVWLVILATIQSNVTAVPRGLISEFRLPTTFIYDGRNQTTVAYDSSGKSADGYDVGAVLTRYEKRDRMTGDGASFAKIADLLAAEALGGINDDIDFVLKDDSKDWFNYMEKRDWTITDIQDTLANGESTPYPKANYLNPGNPTSLVINPGTGKGLVIDNVTKEIIQLGGDPTTWKW